MLYAADGLGVGNDDSTGRATTRRSGMFHDYVMSAMFGRVLVPSG